MPRQAKRLVGFIVSGGLLGGVLGSFTANLLVRAVGTLNQLCICPPVLILCIFVFNRYRNIAGAIPEKTEMEAESKAKGKGWSEFWALMKNRYLLL